MAIREILTIPNPILKQVSTPVEGGVTDEIRALMDDMLETMYAAPGIGLAAVQIGVPKRIIVMDLGGPNDEKQPKYFVNPEIVETIEDTQPYEEGCLSVPDYYDEVERPARCLIRYLDYDGNQVEEWAEDLYAVCIQHEMDHLEGTLFIDHLSRLRRQRAVEKVKKAKRQKERVA
ncbi:peptide deformylase [Ponticaulis sp.]|uniref:peptide deformylase n=1 Tax=Ponticaulis sp. TaxID=2020902 RepID=UPI000B70B45B|nr:peptide deformylase [Ponticaulis sp.]MAJ07433.1 peptide deformylase [Ponticaulis sp.]HBJ92908.1 peptide deformylase [Hyphomonadaceae bacterium]|tara:strand:+ start:17388 stop:17912 length:525 start_codon:yes stop_codon:yes gene_type:complete